MWADLQPVGRSAHSGGYRRFAWTRTDHDLREWFAGECTARGLDVTDDRMGNQWAWWGEPDDAARRGDKGVVTGSHLDSVPDGGAFDGPLGVVSAFAALDVLRDNGFQPARPIGIVNFVDEEGARFGVACAGSRVITGAMTADRARGLTDADGVTMAEALEAAGRDARHLGRDDETLGRIGAFVELHVEQGRGLVDLENPVAVATDIWPHGRWRLDFPGEANHAGTTRLEDRQDAMLGYAGAVLAAREAAISHGCVATIGKVEVTPGGVNAIPSAVTGWLDARGASPRAVRRAVADVRSMVEQAGGHVTEESWTPSTPFDPALSDRVRDRLGGVPMLGTGAGHDAGILANAGIRTAMLFVRNPTGVSHSPLEFAELSDCLEGVAALGAVLEDLAGAPA
ncbi:allantoate amidohydrolase [Pedococcus sp. 5OH_020]|uniref:allantoate amidohydrolase n=1 Tax=Pedococcus sp. 5OH_020 TaxID=2989814 RepID=UPI0022EA0E8B|nr:allantoate amidohydrolase [Pedococcus sp. 5OH_020]